MLMRILNVGGRRMQARWMKKKQDNEHKDVAGQIDYA